MIGYIGFHSQARGIVEFIEHVKVKTAAEHAEYPQTFMCVLVCMQRVKVVMMEDLAAEFGLKTQVSAYTCGLCRMIEPTAGNEDGELNLTH